MRVIRLVASATFLLCVFPALALAQDNVLSLKDDDADAYLVLVDGPNTKPPSWANPYFSYPYKQRYYPPYLVGNTYKGYSLFRRRGTLSGRSPFYPKRKVRSLRDIRSLNRPHYFRHGR